MASAEAILPEGFRLRSASGTLTISWRGPTHWVFLFAGAFGLALCGILLAGFALTSRGSTGALVLFGAGLLFFAYLLLVGVFNRTCQADECTAFSGSFWIAAGVGDCSPGSLDRWEDRWWRDSWCYTVGAIAGLSYLDPVPSGVDAWDFDYELDYE